jgi:ADP-ribose pyrophosphatase
MSLRHWKKLSEETVAKNPWWTYKKDLFSLPNGQPKAYHYVHTNGSSMVIPLCDDGRILLVNQYRYLVERESIEFPCGGVKDGTTYEETAQLELEEETGHAASRWNVVGEFNPYNGITNEMCRVFLAQQLRETAPRPEETEEFELLRKAPGEIDTMIQNQIIWDGMTLAAWCLAKPFLK